MAAVKLKKEYALYGSPLPNFPPSPPEVVQLEVADNLGEYTIGWRAPTSTGGHKLTGFSVLMRKGADGAYEEKAKLDQMIGRPLPFADDNLWEKMRTATVPEMRQDHKELSDKLEDMRSKWKQRWNANVERKYRVDEVHRVKEVSAAEKWRERKAAEQSATLKAREGTLRQTWQERMAQRKAERDKSNRGGR